MRIDFQASTENKRTSFRSKSAQVRTTVRGATFHFVGKLLLLLFQTEELVSV